METASAGHALRSLLGDAHQKALALDLEHRRKLELLQSLRDKHTALVRFYLPMLLRLLPLSSLHTYIYFSLYYAYRV